jgi:prolyl-tRNA editing enzyme YbaK/EbsC (Cys-tRNA(Pro) deacylase)
MEIMSLESVKAYLATYGLADKVRVEQQTTATVEEAAQALGVEPGRIAKTMAFHGPTENTVIMIVAAGDVKIANGPFKQQFGLKARMLDAETCEQLTGHHPGGVCPFDLENHPVEVWLDASLKRFPTVFPACGSSDSCIELSIPQLEQTSHAKGWVDVCKRNEATNT